MGKNECWVKLSAKTIVREACFSIIFFVSTNTFETSSSRRQYLKRSLLHLLPLFY